MKVKAYAKINLSLKILGKRPDGFHEIESVMQSVSLHDLITLEPIPSGIQLITNNLRLTTDNRNLAYRAAELFLGRVTGLKIYLEKNIPLAAGLAGGSADAAGVLFGINKLCGNPMSKTELMKLGEQIGSDVPFCLVGGNCTVRGRGENVVRNMVHVSRTYVLVVPEIEVPARWAYETFDQMTNEGTNNDLEPVVIGKFPVVKEIKDKLIELGCIFAQMSGSGPGVFGIVKDAAQGQTIVNKMQKTYPKSFLVTAVNRGVEEAL